MRAPKKILQQSEKILRAKALEVPLTLIKTNKIKKILTEMKTALAREEDGVAIAAPQIGHSLRIFVLSDKIFTKDFAKNRKSLNRNNIIGANSEPVGNIKENSEEYVFINPKISKFSREKQWMPEGCLSVRWLYGKTLRSTKILLSAYDETGKKFTRGASGLLAQIFQHETDHLNGILFIDHAKDIKEELPKK